MGIGELRCDPSEMPAAVASSFIEVMEEGIYLRSFERIVLKSCINDKREYWVNSDSLLQLFSDNYTSIVQADSQLHVTVKAKVSPEGRYGHMGRYRFCLTDVTVMSFRLVSTEFANEKRCGRRR